MQNDNDRPSTETEATSKPSTGENIKALVTPGDDAAKEAEAETRSPKAASDDDLEDNGSFSGRADD